MSLQILANTLSMAAGNLTLPFSASGGTIPYTWSLGLHGPGGSINSSSGVYTSPLDDTGVENIIVTDHLGLQVDIDLSIRTPMELVADIIQHEMGLGDGQVYIYNQKFNIPIDDALYIAIGAISDKPYGNNKSYMVVSGQLSQVQTVNMQALLSINILSRGPAARDQKEQVLLALGSNYAESQMELNSFRVALLSNAFVNLSSVDGAAIPYRFNISAQLKYFVSKVSQVSNFDTFVHPAVLPKS